MQCGTILPSHEVFLTPNGEMIECILERHNETVHHLGRSPRGIIFHWYFECAEAADGEFCTEAEGDCDDFVWYEVDKSEIPVKAQ